jgi:peptidoglycan/xylan/chitin deacetylase (PgdA/CDA1 family)
MRTKLSSTRVVAFVAVAMIAVTATSCRKAYTMVDADAAAPGERVVALTFDDGPSPYTPHLLDVLARHNVKATFFVQGSEAAKYPEILDRIVREGHRVGNHTWSHPRLTGESDGSIAAQVGWTHGWLAQRGINSSCVRPPYGSTDARVDQVIRANSNNSYTMMWSVDPRDWEGHPADVITARVMANLRPGSVVLMHDGGENGANRWPTVDAVDRLIPQIRAAGYDIRPVC